MHEDITIAFHLGAPHTENEQITWSLRKDSLVLAENGIMLRRPGEYRRLLKDSMRQLNGRVATPDEQDVLLTAIVKNQQVSRLILSDASYLSAPAWVLNGEKFYKNAGQNTASIRNLLPDYPVKFFLCIRNPATFLPEAFKTQTEKDFSGFFNRADLHSLRWSDVIADIQHSNPGCPITVWCYEDLPIIWPTVLKELSGLDPQTSFKGGLDFIKGVLTSGGAKRLEAYFAKHPAHNETRARQIRAIYFDKFADADAIEDEIDLPNWTDELIEQLTELYEDDTELIEWMPGVEFISA